jgi:purine catabolism regulator
VLCGGRSGEEPLLALAALPGRAADPEELRATTAALVADTVARVWARRRPGTRAVVGIDGPAGWAEAGPALRIAVQTAAAARALPDRPWHDGRDTELERLLDAGPRDELEMFVQRALGPLLAHDRERKLALLPTLQALCVHGGHKAEAARDLHLHRQALYHRIARIESLLGVDLSDPARLTTLSVALRALPYVG